MTSPYLELPLRTEAQAIAERRAKLEAEIAARNHETLGTWQGFARVVGLAAAIYAAAATVLIWFLL